MFKVMAYGYTLLCFSGGLPEYYDEYRNKAKLVDEIDLGNVEGELCFLGVQKDTHWPFLVVALKHWPSGLGFYPAALLIPETNLLLIGAGERLLAYRLDTPERVWEDSAEMGFLGWERHGEHVIMSAELGIAVWGLYGKKLWSQWVEPPWGYSIEHDSMHLEVMGKQFTFPLQQGPDERLWWFDGR